MYDMCIICKNTQYVPDMYMKSVYFSAFILHISGTDRCKIGVRYLIFRPVLGLAGLLEIFEQVIRLNFQFFVE
jgi:hypothetical protein